MVGFRTFVKNFADSLDIKGYAKNLSDGRVIIVCEGHEEKIREIANLIKTQSSGFSDVDDLEIKYGEYIGEFLTFERLGEDVPEKATLDDLLKVMISFENKAEKIVGVLGQMNTTLNGMNTSLNVIRKNTDAIPAIEANTENFREVLREEVNELHIEHIDLKQGIARIESRMTA